MATNLPNKPLELTYDEAQDPATPISIKILSCPGGSELAGRYLEMRPSSRQIVSPLNPRVIQTLEKRTFVFVPDTSGLYQLELTLPNGTTSSETVEVATKLSHSIGLIERATVVILVQNGQVVSATDAGGGYPRLSGFSSSRGAFAASASTVKSALLSMVGQSASSVNSVGLPALDAAWRSAVESASPSVDGQSVHVATLVGAGWEL